MADQTVSTLPQIKTVTAPVIMLFSLLYNYSIKGCGEEAQLKISLIKRKQIYCNKSQAFSTLVLNIH